MAQLIRWDPFREMMQIREAFDRLFDETFALPRLREPMTWTLALDVAEKDNAYIVKASLPGVNPDDIDISITDNVLTIRGETKVEKDIEKAEYHLRERRYGSFSRSISLPAPVNAEAVEASYENGVLTLHIPKAPEAQPRKIAVKTGKTIEGEASKA
jgi:HSP20 family protein